MPRKKKREEPIGETGNGEAIVPAPMPDPPPDPQMEAIPEATGTETPPPPPPIEEPPPPMAADGEPAPGAGKRRGRPKGSKNKKATPAPDVSVLGFYTAMVQQTYAGIGMILRDPESFDVPEEMARTAIAMPLAQLFPSEDLDPRIALGIGVLTVTGICVAKHVAHRAEVKRQAQLAAPPVPGVTPAPKEEPKIEANGEPKGLAAELAAMGAPLPGGAA